MTQRTRTESVSRTDVGRVRKLNEDNFLDRGEVGLWVVADGMGGHQAGEVASRMIVEAVAQVDSFDTGYALLVDVRNQLSRVNRTLIARAAALKPGAVIGSTVVVLMLYEGHYACLWAGDSRIYRLRDEGMEQLTHDHSMLQELLDAGSVARGDAGGFRKSNVITRAVGVADDLVLDMRQGPLQAGDVFVLCSDGLTGMLTDGEIRSIITDAPSLDEAADALIALTLERGARDNVTVVLVSVVPSPEDTLDGTVISDW